MFLRYQEHRGPILAGGLSYQSIFAVFAALWVGFSVAGLVLRANPRAELGVLRHDQLLDSRADRHRQRQGRGDGRPAAADRHPGLVRRHRRGGLLLTGLGWLASARDAVRALFDLPGERTNFLLLKLKDFGLALGFGAVLLVSAALSVVAPRRSGPCSAGSGSTRTPWSRRSPAAGRPGRHAAAGHGGAGGVVPAAVGAEHPAATPVRRCAARRHRPRRAQGARSALLAARAGTRCSHPSP